MEKEGKGKGGSGAGGRRNGCCKANRTRDEGGKGEDESDAPDYYNTLYDNGRGKGFFLLGG